LGKNAALRKCLSPSSTSRRSGRLKSKPGGGDDDFLQGNGVVLFLTLKLGFEIGVALFQPLNILLPALYFQ
jgi:hypothetical protein